MRILVLNAGSSTLKWTLLDGREVYREPAFSPGAAP